MYPTGHAFDLLAPAEIERIHDGALQILARMGVEVQNHRLLGALAEHGALVDLRTQRATFPRPLVEDFIAAAPGYDWSHPLRRVGGSAGVYAGSYHDPDTDALRPWTAQDLARYAHLARSVPHVTGVTMLGSRLAPGPLEPLLERYESWRIGAVEGGSILTDEVCPYLLELYEAAAAEREQPLAEVFRGTVYLIPALKLGRHEAFQVDFFRQHGLEVRIGQSMATLGATAPVTLAGAVTLNLAEQIALGLLRWAFFERRELHIGCSLAPMDMRTAIRPYGRPEMAIANLMSAQLARHYGVAFSGHAGLTDAKRPSTEAGAQKTLSALATLSVGGDLWLDAGLLGVDEIMSPIQMVLDGELLSALSRFTRETRVDADTLGLDTILAAGPGGQYLDSPHTARHFRDELWMPRIWSQQMTPAWIEEGRLTDVDRAREIVRQIYAEHDRVAPPSHISDAFEKEILRVIDRARVKLG